MIALATAVFAAAGALFSWLGKRHAGAVNDAVNKRHASSPKLYDLAVTTSEDTKANQAALVKLTAANGDEHKQINARIDNLEGDA